MRRLFAVVFAAGVVVLVTGAPAIATITKETGIKCSGSAIVTEERFAVGTQVRTFSVDARQAKVTLPRSGTAAWKGSVAPATHNHSGQVWVDAGVKDIEMGSWSSKNAEGKPGTSGVKKYDIPKWVPPFRLSIGGFHTGKEGSCEGSIILDLDGSLFSSWVGLTNTGLMIGAAGLFVSSGFAKGRP